MAIKSFLSEGGFSVGSVGSAPIEVIDSSGNITAVGLTVSGNLVVNGSTTTINSTTTTLDDPIFTLGGDTVPTSDDNKDRGIEFRWHNGSLAKVGFFGYDDSTGKFVFIPDATNTSEVFSGTKGTIDANLEWADVLNKPSPVVTVTLTGDVTGTANTTLTSLGNGTVTISTTVAADSVALGTDTTGNYVASITNGSYITGGNGGSEGAALTLAVDATSANTASKVVARDASGNFSAGLITATGMTLRGASTLTQLVIDTTTSGSKEIVFYDAGAFRGYVWNSGSVIGIGGGSGNNSLFVNTTTGNTGVGTSSPGGRLEVNFTAATAATALILRTSDSGANGAIRWQNSGGTNQAGIGSNFNVSDVGALEFLNGTTTNVIFRSSGNVGIGKTNPQQKLHIAGTNARIAISNDADNNWAEIGNDGASGQNTLEFFTGSSTVPAMSITHANNVGIGMSPGTRLNVKEENSGTEGFIVTNWNGVNTVLAGSDSISGGGKFTLKTNAGTIAVFISSTASSYFNGGSVGVGVSSPGAKLHVSEASGVGNFAALKLTNTVTSANANVDIIMEAGGQNGARIRAIAPGASHNDLAVFVSNGGTLQSTPAIYVQGSSNRVGINNTSPSNTLDVTGSVRTTDWYYVDGSGFGMYNNATGLYLSSAGNNWDISSGAAQTWAGLRLYKGGKTVTWLGHFYGDSSGQGFLDSSGNWALQLDSSKRLQVYSGVYSIENGTIRVFNPGGATYSDGPALTGAFKIKLPTATYNSNTMMTLVVDIYNYDTGKSLRFRVGGYNYQTGDWYNTFAEQTSDLGVAAYNVRFGSDGTSNCIWIGETNSSWSYPKVYVSEFLGGHSTATAAWASGWAITRVTAFDTVGTTRAASVTVNSNNIGAYGVNYITGTANQVLVNGGSGANVTGGVTLTLPQNIHTAATPTFSSLTLSGDVLTLSGSGVAAYSTNAARIYNQSGVGVTVNANTFEVRTGTSTASLALSVSNTQNTTLAGTLTVSGTGDSTIAGTLGVGGAAYYSNKFTVDGSAIILGVGIAKTRGDHVTTIVNADGGNTSSNIAFQVKNSAGTSLLQSTYGGAVTVPGTFGSTGGISSGGNITFSTDQTAYYIKGPANGGAIRIRSNSAAATDRNVQIGNVDNAGSWSSYMTVETTGNVGVGTTSPGYKLEVAGSTLVTKLFVSTANASYDLYNNGTSYLNGAVTTGSTLTANGNTTVQKASGNDVTLSLNQIGVAQWTFKNNATSGTLTIGNGAADPITIPAGASPTVSIANGLTVGGNLIVSGTTTTINSTVSTIKDPVITLGGGDAGTAAASDDNKDRGIEFKWHNGTSAKTGFFGFQDSTGYLTFIPDATNTSEVFSGTKGTIDANLVGNVTGSLSNALTAGSYLTGSPTSSYNGSVATTFNVDATSANTASKVVARDGSGNFSAGTITAALSGNATTATTLQTARNIAGVSFNGSADISITGQNITNSSGTAANDIEVAKYMRWKNYGNNHILIDASAGTNPGGGAIDRYTAANTITNAGAGSNTWGEAISLMGWNGSATYGVRVDRARTIDNQANSATTTAATANTASTIVLRDASGNFSASGITASSFTDGYNTFTLAQINRSAGAVELQYNKSAAGENVHIFGNTANRWAWQADTGKLVLGSAGDTNLYRSAADTLKTDDNFTATGITVTKSSGISTITFPAGFNDPGYIQHEESVNNTGIMRFSVSDDDGDNDYFTFGNTSNGYQERFRIFSNGRFRMANGIWHQSLSDGANRIHFGASGRTYFGSQDGYEWRSAADSAIMYLSNGGSLGIGTTAPQTKLDVFVGANNTFAASFGHNVGAGSFAGFSFGYQETTNFNYRKSGLVFERTDAHGQGGNASGKIHFLLRNDGASSANTLTDSVVTIDSDASGTRSSVRVGIGTKTPTYTLEVNGSFAATTKSFVIKHPTKEGKKLRYGSLEGPENGVYVRGKLKGSNIIELPDYWTKLVDPESITVQLTPIGSHQKLYVEKIENNKVYIANENLLAKAINCFYYVLAERCDVEKLEVEIDA